MRRTLGRLFDATVYLCVVLVLTGACGYSIDLLMVTQ